MIVFLLFGLIGASVVCGMLSGSSAEVSGAVISSGADAVSLVLTLIGTMAVWGGITEIAGRSGITEKLTNILMPFLRLIFRNLKKDSEALRLIAMNVSANLFGLGNAATPLGIEAMQALEREEAPGETASRNMIMLAVMNACSVELIPATVAALRAQAGSAAPMEILPCVLVVSLGSLTAALLTAEVLNVGSKNGH